MTTRAKGKGRRQIKLTRQPAPTVTKLTAHAPRSAERDREFRKATEEAVAWYFDGAVEQWQLDYLHEQLEAKRQGELWQAQPVGPFGLTIHTTALLDGQNRGLFLGRDGDGDGNISAQHSVALVSESGSDRRLVDPIEVEFEPAPEPYRGVGLPAVVQSLLDDLVVDDDPYTALVDAGAVGFEGDGVMHPLCRFLAGKLPGAVASIAGYLLVVERYGVTARIELSDQLVTFVDEFEASPHLHPKLWQQSVTIDWEWSW